MKVKVALVIAVAVAIVLLLTNRKLGSYVNSDQVQKAETVIVLDPGHGGSDPGKIGINGLLEKDINLSITKMVKKKLEKEKLQVVLTREKDEMLIGPSGKESKVEDLKCRVQKINEVKPVLAVSIHQNSYHEEGEHGAQVFYYTHSDEGKAAAGILQQALLEVDPDNGRKEKANDSYYLLRKTEVPTVIVECGFLSNGQEADRLGTKEYQEILADAITDGIKKCMENTEGK